MERIMGPGAGGGGWGSEVVGAWGQGLRRKAMTCGVGRGRFEVGVWPPSHQQPQSPSNPRLFYLPPVRFYPGLLVEQIWFGER